MIIIHNEDSALGLATCEPPTRHQQRLTVGAVVDHMGSAALIPAGSRVARSESGRPFLSVASKLNLSISHSGPWVAVACSTHPIGIDVEKRSQVSPEAWSLFASPAELTILPPVRIWSIKEASLKCWDAVGQLSMREIYVNADGTVGLLGFPPLRWILHRPPHWPEVVMVVPQQVTA